MPDTDQRVNVIILWEHELREAAIMLDHLRTLPADASPDVYNLAASAALAACEYAFDGLTPEIDVLVLSNWLESHTTEPPK